MNKFLINDFEGPLDLLLHLVKQSKMEIADIKITEITEQYLNYINEMTELNLDIASEYLVMACELVEMKSKYLLPKKEENNDEDSINIEDELKKRLLEYKKYKENTNKFRELEVKRKNFYTKNPEILNEITDKKVVNYGEVSIFDLMDALKKLMNAQELSRPMNTKITKKELSIKERIDKIRNVLKEKKRVSFNSLFEEFSKSYIVVTFLSVLQMCKDNEIVLRQKDNFGEILIERVE